MLQILRIGTACISETGAESLKPSIHMVCCLISLPLHRITWLCCLISLPLHHMSKMNLLIKFQEREFENLGHSESTRALRPLRALNTLGHLGTQGTSFHVFQQRYKQQARI